MGLLCNASTGVAQDDFGAGTLPRIARGVALSQSPTARMFELEGIDHVALSVSDVERSASWYVEVLGLERRYSGMWAGIPVFVGKGTTALALFPARKLSTDPSRSLGMLHLAFRTTAAGFIAAQDQLKQRGISFDFEDHEISHSIYFRDPDGHNLEITTYELG